MGNKNFVYNYCRLVLSKNRSLCPYPFETLGLYIYCLDNFWKFHNICIYSENTRFCRIFIYVLGNTVPSEGNSGGFIKVEVRVRRKQWSYCLVICCTETGHGIGKGLNWIDSLSSGGLV